MTRLHEIRIRDPYIVLHEDIYYLYGTYICEPAKGEKPDDKRLFMYKSKDLVTFAGPECIFELEEESWGERELWAPEVHKYGDRFYLFVSILGKNGLRGTQIAVSDTPESMFVPVINEPATPPEQSCIDGTLYVEDGIPYIVYSHDWPDCYHPEKDCYIGEICAQRLSEDLIKRIGDPFLLFSSTACPHSAKMPSLTMHGSKEVRRYGSDGPFLRKMKNGTLQLYWSPYPGRYIVCTAVSKSGKLQGPWEHEAELLFADNGGHPMLFHDRKGQEKLVIHWPEKYPEERTRILDVKEVNGTLKVVY